MPFWLVVLAGKHGHTVMATYPHAYMTYIVSPLALAGLGGGISWRPPPTRLQLVADCVDVSLNPTFKNGV